MQAKHDYWLYIDDNKITTHQSLEAAKLASKSALSEKLEARIEARIETMVAPAPSQIWIYDHEENLWVEQR